MHPTNFISPIARFMLFLFVLFSFNYLKEEKRTKQAKPLKKNLFKIEKNRHLWISKWKKESAKNSMEYTEHNLFQKPQSIFNEILNKINKSHLRWFDFWNSILRLYGAIFFPSTFFSLSTFSILKTLLWKLLSLNEFSCKSRKRETNFYAKFQYI